MYTLPVICVLFCWQYHAAKTTFICFFLRVESCKTYILSICNIHLDIFSFHFLPLFICDGILKGNKLWRHQLGGNQWFGAQQFPTNCRTIDWLLINYYTAPTESHNVDKAHGSGEEAAGFIKMEWNLKESKEKEGYLVTKEHKKVSRVKNNARKESHFIQICIWNYEEVKTDA